ASLPTNLDSVGIRIDQSLPKGVHLFGRYSGTSSDINSFPGNPNIIYRQKLKSRTLTIGANAILRSSLQNELRLNYSVNVSLPKFNPFETGGGRSYDTSLLYPSPLKFGRDSSIFGLLLPDNAFTTNPGPSGKFSQRQINVVDGLSSQLGSHHIKVGVDYRRL